MHQSARSLTGLMQLQKSPRYDFSFGRKLWGDIHSFYPEELLSITDYYSSFLYSAKLIWRVHQNTEN